MPGIRLMHYLNQFFAGQGGEDKAELPLALMEGPVGPGRRLQSLLGDSGEIVVTVYCGDNYFPSHSEETLASIVKIAREHDVGMLVAGPSFGSGRYGFSCAEICHAAANSLGLRCVTGMHPENSGLEVYRNYRDSAVFALPTTQDASGMEEALSKMAKFVANLAANSPIGSASQEGYIPRGVRLNEIRSRNAAGRAIDMLLNKVAGRPFETEVPLEVVEPIPVAPRLGSLKDAHLALVSTAGVVAWGNPDGFKSVRNTHWRKYSIEGLNSMQDSKWEVMHGGYNTDFMRDNPNYGVPLDACRQREKEGTFARLYPYLYATTGVLALISDMQAIGAEMVRDMRAEGIDGAVLVST